MFSTDFTWKIEPKSSLLHLDVKGIWEYRDLIWLFVRRDIVSFYKQTILGPLWFLIQPIFTTITYIFIFGKLASISTDGVPGPLFYFIGVVCWNYFSECLTKTSSVFKDNAQLFAKAYFPRIIIPLSLIISNLARFGVQLSLFILALIYFKLYGGAFTPNANILIFPFVVIIMAFLGLGLGMVVSSLTTKYRDLSFLISFGAQLLMYTTTIVYPLSVVPAQYKYWVKLNPMTGLVEAIRFGFLGSGSISWGLFSYSCLSTVLILFTGIIAFNKVEKSFIDTI